MAANEAKIVITADDKASGKLDGISEKAKKMRTAFLAVSGAVTGVGLVSVKFASDLNEAVNKAAVTFGDASRVVEEFAKTSADTFGISKRAANEYAGTLGTILNASGIAQQASADMSVELLKLAADMASFNDIPIDVALEKLRSGLVGEVEPLRTVGVLLNAAAVETQAYNMGIAEQGAKLTEAQKVQARYALIMQQTTAQQGDFARTSDSLANSTRSLGAELEDAAAELGQQLLPAAQKVVEIANDLIQKFSDLSPEMKTTILVVGGVAGALAVLGLAIPPVIASLGLLTGGFTATWAAANLLVAHPVIAALAAMALATGLITKVTLNWLNAQETAEEASERLKADLDDFKLTVQDTIPELEGFRENVNTIRHAEEELQRATEDLTQTNDDLKLSYIELIDEAQEWAEELVANRDAEIAAQMAIIDANKDFAAEQLRIRSRVAAENKRIAEEALADELQLIEQREDALEAIQKGERERFEEIKRAVMGLPPVIASNINQGSPQSADIFNQMGANAMVIDGRMVTRSVTGQLNYVLPTTNVPADFKKGSPEFERFLLETLELNARERGVTTIVVEGDVYGFEDFADKVEQAQTQNRDAGAIR